MFKFIYRSMFEALEKIPGLQRKDWELNQTGADRGLEAVLIQRTTREVATYALVQLRIAVMPELLAGIQSAMNEAAADDLLSWAKSQGPGGSMMIKVITGTTDMNDRRRIAALSVIKYYHKREDDNPAVKSPWTDDGLRKVPALDISSLLEYPTPGDFWRKKYDCVQSLVRNVLNMDCSKMTDDQILLSLRSIKGVGPQTASMVALFSLSRPVPIIDGYLTSLLANHGLVSESLSSNYAQDELRGFLIAGAKEMALQRPEWPAHRSLSSLYLWACEVGRFHCICGKTPNPDCPVRGFLGQIQGQ